MGTVHEVSVTYSRTVNLGNYESERLEVSQTAMLGQDEAPEVELRELYTETKAIVQARLREAAEQRRQERDLPAGAPAFYGRAARPPKVDECDEEDDPERPF